PGGSIGAERADEKHQLIVNCRLAIASRVIPRAARDVRIFLDMISQALHCAPSLARIYGKPPRPRGAGFHLDDPGAFRMARPWPNTGPLGKALQDHLAGREACSDRD